MLLWNRSAVVSFGPKGGTGWTKVTGLRITFEIEKTSETTPNTSKISIYNLHPKTWGILESGENFVVILEVGYGGGNVAELYRGDIKKSSNMQEGQKNTAPVTVTHQGPDVVTTIEAEDGINALQGVTFDKSYIEGMDLKTPLIEVINQLKAEGKMMVDQALNFLGLNTSPKKTAQTGLCLSGQAQSHLDTLCHSLGLEWSVQDNNLQLFPQGGDTGEDAILLTPKTGLVGSPVRRNEGIEFTALIQPKIKPGRKVKIESSSFTGTYIVRKAKFNGDTHDQAWYVTAEAK